MVLLVLGPFRHLLVRWGRVLAAVTVVPLLRHAVPAKYSETAMLLTVIASQPVHRCCCVKLQDQVLNLQRNTKMSEPDKAATRNLRSQRIDRVQL